MNRRSRPTPRAGLTPKAGTCRAVMVGGWGGEEKRSYKGSSGSVRGLSCPNSTMLMSALGVGQKGESQKFLFCGHYLRGRMDRKRTAQEDKEKER